MSAVTDDRTTNDSGQIAPVVRQQRLSWVFREREIGSDEPNRWELHFRDHGHTRNVATVWANGTWHTWDQDGIGGENSTEVSVGRARIEAAASAIAQGFV